MPNRVRYIKYIQLIDSHLHPKLSYICVRVCACARVRVCACARVRVCACARVRGCACARRHENAGFVFNVALKTMAVTKS